MKVFNVFYPVEGMNHECSLDVTYDFEYALACDSLNEAFKNGQHDFNSSLEHVGCRSMCVGDVIMDDEHKLHMVMGVGFKEVTDQIKFHVDY
jgi:hypothetical protein